MTDVTATTAGLIQGAGEIGDLFERRTELHEEWTKLYDQGVIQAFDQHNKGGVATVPEQLLKTYGRVFVREQNPRLYQELQEIETKIETLLGSARLLEAAGRSMTLSGSKLEHSV